MRTFSLTFILIALLSTHSYSQTWNLEWEKYSQSPNQDYFKDVCETPDGEFVVLGSKGANNLADIWLLCFNSKGDTLWTRKFKTPGKDQPTKLTGMTNGDFLILGETGISDNSKILLIRTDRNGNELWRKLLDDGNFCKGKDIAPLPDNGFVIVGSKNTDTQDPHPWMAKMDENGNMIWEQMFSEKGCLATVKQLPNDEFILSGQVIGKVDNDCDILVMQTNNSGKMIWQNKMLAPTSKEWPECVCCSPDSCFIMVGWAGNCLNDIADENPIFDYDLMVKKLDSKGKVLWAKNFDSEGSEGGNAVAIRPDGKLLIAGVKLTSFTGKVGPWLLEVDEQGNILNESLLNMNLSQANKVINTSDGGFVVIGPGIFERLGPHSDGWIMKFNGL